MSQKKAGIIAAVVLALALYSGIEGWRDDKNLTGLCAQVSQQLRTTPNVEALFIARSEKHSGFRDKCRERGIPIEYQDPETAAR